MRSKKLNPNSLQKKELDALVFLLDDPDQEVNKMVIDKLISCGPGIVPDLENLTQKVPDIQIQQKLEFVIQTILHEEVTDRMKNWVHSDRDNLLEAALIIAKYNTPSIDENKLRADVEKLKRDIWLEMNYNLTPLEQVNVFNHVFYSINGFTANNQNLFDASNNFIDTLLETRKGNPVSLGLLYLILARELEMPVYGVNLSQHFILSYHSHALEENEKENEIRKSILFYINCLNKGIIFSRDDISLFLKRINIEPQPHHYVPCDNLTIITLLVNNLIQAYEMNGIADKVNDYLKLKDILRLQ
jgi:hypothetical protein